MPKHSLLPPILIPPVMAAIMLVGCGTAPVGGVQRLAARPVAKGQLTTQSLAVQKIQTLAATAIAEAEQKPTWNDRAAVAAAAVKQIDEIKLQGPGLTNLSSKVAINAVRPYGYIGMWPNAENRFKVQSVALAFFKTNASEPALAKGSPIFAMSADMIASTTNADQGFKVGVAVLSTIRDEYKDKEISKTCQAILDKACDAQDRGTGTQVMVEGLRKLAVSVSG